VKPDAFDFQEVEFTNSHVKTQHPAVLIDWTGRHAPLYKIDMSGAGLARH